MRGGAVKPGEENVLNGDLNNELFATVFLEQPLALPGSVNERTSSYSHVHVSAGHFFNKKKRKETQLLRRLNSVLVSFVHLKWLGQINSPRTKNLWDSTQKWDHCKTGH